MAKPRRGGKGGKRPGRGGCTALCSLTNLTSSTTETSACKDGSDCNSDSLDFQIVDDQVSASFCVRPEDDETPEEVEAAEPEMFIKFVLRGACSVMNGTSGEEKTRKCRRGHNCTLAGVTVEEDGHVLTATYCQDEQETIDWMQIFNGRRRGKSSEESSEESSDENDSAPRAGFGRFRGGKRRGRRDARGEFRGGPCNITDAAGVEIESAACPEESACAVGPVVADDNETAINIFFCERPERPSKESSDETSEEDEADEEEMDEEDHIARKMFCNACSLSKNGTDVEVKETCDDGEDCTAGPISADINGTEVVAKFCSLAGEDFSLIQALQCGRKGGKGKKSGRKSGERKSGSKSGRKGKKSGRKSGESKSGSGGGRKGKKSGGRGGPKTKGTKRG